MANHPGLLMVTGSIRDELVVDELMHRCDAVVHLAAAVGVRLIIEEPLRSFSTNLRGSEVVIGAAHRYQRPILIASTSEVYGKNGHSALTETADRILGPTTVARWAYSTAKAVDEILALTYHRERGLPVGGYQVLQHRRPAPEPGLRHGHPDAGETSIAGPDPSPYSGMDSRAAASATWRIPSTVSCAYWTTAGPSGRYSTSDRPRRSPSSNWPRPSWTGRARTPTIQLVPYDQAYLEGFEDMRRRVPDISKIEALTGWRPRHTLDDILTHTIADVRWELGRCSDADQIATGNDLIASSASLEPSDRRGCTGLKYGRPSRRRSV